MIDYNKLTTEQMVELINRAKPGEARIVFNNVRAVIEDRVATRFYSEHEDTVKSMFLEKIKVDEKVEELEKKLEEVRKKYYLANRRLKRYGEQKGA